MDRLEQERALTLRLVSEQGWAQVTVPDVHRLSVEVVREQTTGALEERGMSAAETQATTARSGSFFGSEAGARRRVTHGTAVTIA